MTFCLLLVAFSSCRPSSDKAFSGKPVIDRQRYTIHSRILNEDREIWINLPHTQHLYWFDPRGGLAVAYVLDGESHFDLVNSLQRNLSSVNGNADCPPLIVVGLVNLDRTLDLTPSHSSAVSEANGGGESYLRFIREELFPFVDSVCHPGPYRMLVGHSLGGLLTLHALAKYPDMFNSYVSIDPSLTWDRYRFLDTTIRRLSKPVYSGKSLYVATANPGAYGRSREDIVADTLADDDVARAAFRLGDSLNQFSENGLDWQATYYDNENNGSVSIAALRFALRNIFYDYEFLQFDTLLTLRPEDGLRLVLQHFRDAADSMGADAGGMEWSLNAIGYWLLDRKELERAKVYFAYNLQHFPESPDAYDSMGDWMLKAGDNAGGEKMKQERQSRQEAAERALRRTF